MAVEVRFYKGDNGRVPVLEWLKGLQPDAQIKVRAKLGLLQDYGRDLRRPHSENLQDGIFELRIKCGRVHYRLLYFFHKGMLAVVSHGFAKKSQAVPQREIELAKTRRTSFLADPDRYSA